MPGEIEWEIAARGGDGRTYSWGNSPPTCQSSNSSYLCQSDLKGVGSFPLDQSPFGVVDMVGNVEEWVRERYSQKHPDQLKVIRGGSFRSDEWHSRLSHRFHAKENETAPYRGFRCSS